MTACEFFVVKNNFKNQPLAGVVVQSIMHTEISCVGSLSPRAHKVAVSSSQNDYYKKLTTPLFFHAWKGLKQEGIK